MAAGEVQRERLRIAYMLGQVMGGLMTSEALEDEAFASGLLIPKDDQAKERYRELGRRLLEEAEQEAQRVLDRLQQTRSIRKMHQLFLEFMEEMAERAQAHWEESLRWVEISEDYKQKLREGLERGVALSDLDPELERELIDRFGEEKARELERELREVERELVEKLIARS